MLSKVGIGESAAPNAIVILELWNERNARVSHSGQ